MNGMVAVVSGRVDERCHASACRAQGCTVSLRGAPTASMIVDLDCDELGLVGGDACVVPRERVRFRPRWQILGNHLGPLVRPVG